MVRPEQPGIQPGRTTDERSHRLGADPVMWEALEPGSFVTVTERNRNPYNAVIDDRTLDRTVVWVIPSDGAKRRAYHCADDVDIKFTESPRLRTTGSN